VFQVFYFLCRGDSNPERAKSVKKKLPVASFLAFWCEGGYRKVKPLGRQARKTRSGFIPDGSPKNLNDLFGRSGFFFISKGMRTPWGSSKQPERRDSLSGL